MIKKVCLHCKQGFIARDDSLNYCCALHHKAAVEEATKLASKNKPKARNRKFEPTIDDTFFIKERHLRAKRNFRVKTF